MTQIQPELIQTLDAALQRHEKALRKANQSLSRKQKYSSNWYKSLEKLERVQRRIDGVRQHQKHLSSQLSQGRQYASPENASWRNKVCIDPYAGNDGPERL